jgi:HlyD family secretion protein
MGNQARLEQDTRNADFKGTLLELRAPQAGVVKDLATNTKGAVVQPGMVLLTLVPKGEQLVAEVQIKNEDIGFVQVGQNVRVKLAAHPFQKYGLLDGTVLNVATDAQSGTNGNTQGTAATSNGTNSAANAAGYKAILKLNAQYLEATDGKQAQRLKHKNSDKPLKGEIFQ